MSVDFKIGADPEFFLFDTKENRHVSAYGMIPGTKRNPLPVTDGAVQVDGMALEFNINPASSLSDFIGNTKSVLKDLRDMIPSRYRFDFIPVAHFGKDYIDAQPLAARELGCDPDYNAYSGDINPKPNGDLGFRTASGHIHVGWTEGQDPMVEDHVEACKMLVKQLDCYLGLTSLFFDTDHVRRQMYGDLGSFRPKHYGVEYRTLSNFWLDDEKKMEFIYNETIKAADSLMDQNRMYNVINPLSVYYRNGYKDIYNIINSHIPLSTLSSFNYFSEFARPLMGKSREECSDWNKDSLDPHLFLNPVTYKWTHYRDINPKNWRNLFHANDARVAAAKDAGIPFEDLEEWIKGYSEGKVGIKKIYSGSYRTISLDDFLDFQEAEMNGIEF